MRLWSGPEVVFMAIMGFILLFLLSVAYEALTKLF
jgi:hypothetical protein